jgi:WD40 repeat protein
MLPSAHAFARLARRPLFAVLCLAALALFALGTPTVAQDKKDDKAKTDQDKKDDKAKIDQDKKDDKAKTDQDKKDDKAKTDQDKKADQDKKDDKAKTDQDKKKDQPGKKKGDLKKGDPKRDDVKIEPPPPKDTRIYPKAEPILEIKGHTDWITRVFYSPDGKTLVTISRDRTLRVWDVASGKEVFKIKDLPDKESALALSPDGAKVATTAGKWVKEKQTWVGEILIYDVKNGKQIRTIKGHAEPILAIVFGPQGETLATASRDGTAKVWDIASGKELHNLKGHVGPVEAVVYSGDGKWIATGGADKTVKVWDSSSGMDVQTLKGPAREVSSLVRLLSGRRATGRRCTRSRPTKAF